MPDHILSSSGRLVCRLLPADVQAMLDALEQSADNAARLERLVNTLLAHAERLTVRCEQYRREIELANVEAAELRQERDGWHRRAEEAAGDALLVAVLRPRAARLERENHELRVLLRDAAAQAIPD